MYIEYGLIAGLIAVVIIASVRLLGTNVSEQILDHRKRSDLRTPALPAMAASPAPWQAPSASAGW